MTDDKQEPSCYPNGNLFPGNRGLTMRDHFAGLAMQAIVSTKASSDSDAIARTAYKVAESMMKARSE